LPSSSVSIRFLLLGEGETEIGTENRCDPDGGPDAVAPLVLRKAVDHLSSKYKKDVILYTFHEKAKATDIRVPSSARLSIQGTEIANTGKMWRAKLMLAITMAETKGFNGLFVCVDRESLDSSGTDLYEIVRTMESQFGKGWLPKDFILIVCNPSRCIETWLLADANTCARVIGASHVDPFTKSPEDRPDPSDLKEYLTAAAGSCGMNLHRLRIALASDLDCAQVAMRCKGSYTPFARMTKQLLSK